MGNFHEMYIYIYFFFPEGSRFIVQIYMLRVNYDGKCLKIIY